MTPERWQRIKDLLEQIETETDADPGSGKVAVFDRLCEGDPGLRADAAPFVFADDSDTFIRDLIGEQAASLRKETAQDSAERQERFGRYRLVRRIGQGGMGAVYEAVRVDDFHKKVALKIIRQGLDSDFARSRFLQERQMLAALEHPYIARLLDGGEADDGSPYLVLEFVDGAPITDYCAKLDQEARLRLFLKVCEAVEYAHRSLVVHRDLKPANILVTAGGEPKLLDFGIAKLLDPALTQSQTSFAALTPEYASPEQIRGEPITTASDVYSLGVILYQLLTGSKPYTFQTLTPLEMDRVICVEDPAPPRLGDELDHILLMALRKEPDRRYGSAQKLAEDIDNYLANRPVLARPDTHGYRAKKFVRRNWWQIAAAATIALTVAGGTAIALQQARIAGQRFDQVRRLAHSFVFDYNDDLAKLQGTTQVREKMVGTALEYLDNLSRSAGSDLELQKEVAAAYQKVGDAQGYPTRASLGHTVQALASYHKAAEIHERIAVRDPLYHRTLGAFYIDYAQLLRYTGDDAGATKMAEAILPTLRENARLRPEDQAAQLAVANALCSMGAFDDDINRNRAALEKFRECDAIARKSVAAHPGDRAALVMAQDARAGIGGSAMATGNLAESLAAYEDNERILRELLRMEPDNPGFLHFLALLGQFRSVAYYDDGEPSLNDPAQSLKYARQYLEQEREMVRRDPGDASSRLSYAIALFRMSYPLRETDPAGAVTAARESVGIFDAMIAGGKSSWLVTSRRGRALRRLSEALLAAHQPREAREAAALALTAQRETAARHPKDFGEAELLAFALVDGAEASDAVGDSAAALGALTEAEEIARRLEGENSGELTALMPKARIDTALAQHWRKAGDEKQAQHWFGEVLRAWDGYPEQNDYVRRQSAAVRAMAERRK